jgi:hypothetical protein
MRSVLIYYCLKAAVRFGIPDCIQGDANELQKVKLQIWQDGQPEQHPGALPIRIIRAHAGLSIVHHNAFATKPLLASANSP